MTEGDRYPAPPFDRELIPVLAARTPGASNLEMLLASRSTPPLPPIDELLAARDLVREDRSIQGPESELLVSILKRRTHVPGGPGIFHIHGGGMVVGTRFTNIDRVLEWVQQFDAVAVSVEYRLAPEHPDPAPVNDCFTGLLWTASHADELGFDGARLVVTGASAGGGLAAGTALMARDTGGPSLAAQVLICPMLDDRGETVSSHQIDGIGVWDRRSNHVGWDALLGDRRGTDRVSIYAAPARATDLSRLPPTYIDCGTAEVFRDECVAYAMGIWAAGGIADLHAWAGGYHGFDMSAPTASLSIAAKRTRTEFVRRILGLSEVDRVRPS